jgi:hypothetical protein
MVIAAPTFGSRPHDLVIVVGIPWSKSSTESRRGCAREEIRRRLCVGCVAATDLEPRLANGPVGRMARPIGTKDPVVPEVSHPS